MDTLPPEVPSPETPSPEAPLLAKEATPNLRHFLWDLIEVLLLSVVLFLIIDQLSARIRVDGYSMFPTLHDGEYVLVNRLAYRLGKPERGDVIIFKHGGTEYVKRIIGLPGDEIKIGNGQVIVNGHPLEEPYINAAPTYQGNWVVPEDRFFVLGDNRNSSSDSHQWGFVAENDVVGKAIMVYLPITRLRIIGHPDLQADAVKVEIP